MIEPANKPPRAPLVPDSCDLTGLPYMPLETRRLLNSDFVLCATDAEFRAGLMLWVRSWERVPATSLPADDTALARLLGLSRPQWIKVKPSALRNWVECSDGKLYHPVLARLALVAWTDRLTARLKSGKGHEARWGKPFNRAEAEAALDQAKAMLAAMPGALPEACQAKAEGEGSQRADHSGAGESRAASLRIVAGAA